MKYIKVKGNRNLLRDNETNAIINVNTKDYNNYIKVRNNKLNNEEKILNLESELCSLKDDINELKGLLKNIVNKLD